MLILFFFVLNLVISIANAIGCGLSWPESKHYGGWSHFMNWMGAIMSACGFTWCYMIIVIVIGMALPIDLLYMLGESEMPAELAGQPLVSTELAQIFFELGYVVIIFPVLGSGLAITANSWAHFYRRRTIGNAAIGGYNTFAQMFNTITAARELPGIFKHLTGFFSGGGDGKNKLKLLVIVMVVAAVLAGILTTVIIIHVTAKAHARRMEYKYS